MLEKSGNAVEQIESVMALKRKFATTDDILPSNYLLNINRALPGHHRAEGMNVKTKHIHIKAQRAMRDDRQACLKLEYDS